MNKILIIDDDPSQVALLSHILAGNYDVYCAADGKSALAMSEEKQFDMFIVDMHLPDCSGLDLLKEFASRRTSKDAIKLMITADESESLIEKAFADGALDFLRKPVNHRILKAKIKSLFHYKELADELEERKSKLAEEKMILSKFLSPEARQEIERFDVGRQVSGKTKELTIMVCDMRDSTTISEAMSADAFAFALSGLFNDISDLIYGFNGSIIEFRGDGFLATFQTPADAASSIMKMSEYINMYNQFSGEGQIENVRFGFGLATGLVFLGSVGSVQKVEYIAVGEPVDIASRLESLTKVARVGTLVDKATRSVLGEAAKCKVVKFPKIRGQIGEKTFYSLESYEPA